MGLDFKNMTGLYKSLVLKGHQSTLLVDSSLYIHKTQKKPEVFGKKIDLDP